MLKISKEKGKFKRRIPFSLEKIDTNQMNRCMIYLERFPEELDH